MENEKIFSSKITRSNYSSKNNFHEVLQIVPAIPLLRSIEKQNKCDYVPKTDKYYIPKKKSGLKVKTVRNIRTVFEQDEYSYLAGELEKQRKILLKKISNGSSRDANTKEIAKNILNSDTPVSKSAWHMLMNINPDGHSYSFQYIIWNGKFIQVNGSKGGKNKFMSKYDVGKIFKSSVRRNYLSKANVPLVKKKGLLQNSLNVKFKPGPLTRKKYLDTSYQKHQFGDMELVSLPKPGLEIQTGYGKPLGPVVSTLLYNTFMKDANCVVSEKWAEFAVSVIRSNVKGNSSQSIKSNISFDLSYQCLQNRILMRHDSEIIHNKEIFCNGFNNNDLKEDDSILFSEIERVLNDMLQAVEISLNQDNIYTDDDEPREVVTLDNNISQNCQIKDKPKKKYCELDRLDVTVIRITEGSDENQVECKNATCAFGCVCSSLRCNYNFRNHCGQIDCMFKCKCDVSSYKISDCTEDCSDILPGLINIEKKANEKLAKEEQKFHQTVIMTDDKSILLKSRKRDWKTSKKYADFFSHMQLKPESNLIRELSVVAVKLNCNNIEPWCMVHNLYKCFCKGKFTTTGLETTENLTVKEKTNVSVLPPPDLRNQNSHDHGDILLTNTNNEETVIKKSIRHNTRQAQRLLSEESISDDIETNHILKNTNEFTTCARIESYKGRKYKDSYYINTNLKVSEMEKNDKNLHNKLLNIINKSEAEDDSQDSIETDTFCQVSKLRDLLTNVIEESIQSSSTNNTFEDVLKSPSESCIKRLPHKTKIVSWLESSYKQYKLLADQGIVKSCLDPPKAGKMALYPWDFILSRYRERKNHFLISQQKPFRIFMAVDLKKGMFEKCINIRDIALCDLDNYPITVKNLLSNATDLMDNFCILYGLEHCWELIGSVTKVTEPKIDRHKSDKIGVSDEIIISQEKDTPESNNTQKSSDKLVELGNSSNNITAEMSKWFLMTIENDFSEIQFYIKGFFVKYDSVIKAIHVARASGKTVRLSAQKNNDAQFGIYAIPNNDNYCVFIGPYDKDEQLGIETVKTVLKVGSNRTRGVWITTNKVDNVKVIDNPLSFMASANIVNKKMVPLECNKISNLTDSNPISITTNEKNKSNDEQKTFQTIKPIKIRKTNGLYHLSSNAHLQQIPPLTNSLNVNVKESAMVNKSPTITSKTENKVDLNTINTLSLLKTKKPVAEIAPQVKTYDNKSLKKRREGGMFILNPEEINKRSFEKSRLENSSPSVSIDTTDVETVISLDIESFLATSVVRAAPNSDIYIISDDEEENSRNTSLVDVYIMCKNITNLGWIPGKRNSNGFLSFTFPGFKQTEFYPEKEAFEKINQVISRKVYLPKSISLQWQVCDSLSDITDKPKLESKDLQSDHMMTKQGLRHRYALSKNLNNSLQPTAFSTILSAPDFLAQKENLLDQLDATSTALENESQTLLDETVLKKVEITESLMSASNNMREQFSETLNSMLWFSEDTEAKLENT